MSIQSVLNSAMTAGDLIERLQDFDADTPVLYIADYGDRHHTLQAIPIDHVDDLDESGSSLDTSAYSSSGVCLNDEEFDVDRSANMNAIILKCR